jgi:hypothetical protein
LKEFKSNFKVYEAGKNLIRIDIMDDDKYRYAAWPLGHKISEKPDLILYNGVWEIEGSGGWWSVTFKNSNWTYVVQDIPLDGLKLEVYNGNEDFSYPLKERK